MCLRILYNENFIENTYLACNSCLPCSFDIRSRREIKYVYFCEMYTRIYTVNNKAYWPIARRVLSCFEFCDFAQTNDVSVTRINVESDARIARNMR